jgi:type VI secretion system secreted protein Hcp
MKRSLLLALLAPVALAGSLNAASDYLLEIDGIKGESKDDRHRETIEIASFSWGANNSGASATGGGGGAGKVSFSDIHFTTDLSKASPQVLVACATGRHIPKAILYGRKSGGDRQDYYVITLENVLVSSVKQTGQIPSSTTSTNAAPSEQLSLNFEKITIDYTGEDGTVTTGTAVRTPEK